MENRTIKKGYNKKKITKSLAWIHEAKQSIPRKIKPVKSPKKTSPVHLFYQVHLREVWISTS